MNNVIDNKELAKLLTYMSLFDGGLYKSRKPKKDGSPNGLNAKFIMNMRADNIDYVEWVHETLKAADISSTLKHIPDYNTDGFKRAPLVRLESRAHPKLTTLWERLYLPDGRKVLEAHSLKLLDAETLAIIFMADGGTSLNLQSGKYLDPSVTLCTKGYSEPENMALSKTIYDKLGIRSTLQRQKQYRYLRIKNADIVKFYEIVNPYVKPSFNYKFERVAPYIKHMGGDIVCSSGQLEEAGGNDQPRESE